jgi:glycosyltransferase involved in cell wall biosynthesis
VKADGLRLGFHYHIPAIERGGRIWMPGYLGRFIDSLAAGCREVVCLLHTPAAHEVDRMDYALEAKNVRLVAVGLHSSVPLRTLFAPSLTRPLREQRADLDIMLLRGPSPLLPQMAGAVGSLPLVLLLVGDYLAGVNDLSQPRWRKELIRLWSAWNARRQAEAARRALVLVNSRRLYRQMAPIAKRLAEVRTTTLSQSDFYEREDTCAARPVRLLYSGRYDRGKGLLDMVRAVKWLSEQGEDVALTLVGWETPGDGVLAEVNRLAMDLGIASKIMDAGYQKLGQDLFAFYRAADIYLLASTSSFEGFPRAIWEAMAHSLPVVATRVGSIPDFIEGAAELVEPGHPEELAAAVQRLIHSPLLRREHIQAGLELARANTLERQAADILSNIEAWVSEVSQ